METMRNELQDLPVINAYLVNAVSVCHLIANLDNWDQEHGKDRTKSSRNQQEWACLRLQEQNRTLQ